VENNTHRPEVILGWQVLLCACHPGEEMSVKYTFELGMLTCEEPSLV